MKFTISLGVASAAFSLTLLSTPEALADGGFMGSEEFSGIYDDFTTPVSGDPNPALWDVTTDASYFVSQADGTLTIATAGELGASAKSTADFGYGHFIFDFSNSPNIAHLGFGIVSATGGDDGILLRNESGALRLDVVANSNILVHGVARVGQSAPLSPSYVFGANDVWEFHYLADHLTLVQNGDIVYENDLDLSAIGRVNFSLFAYSGGTMTLDSVSVIPEPSTYAMIAGVLALVFGVIRRRVRQ